MYRTHQVPPVDPPSPPRPNNKVFQQRQYREKEGESFSALRDAIKQISGEEPQTRQEILRKAIELLYHYSGIGVQQPTRIVSQASGSYDYGMPATGVIDPADTGLAHSGYPAQSSHHDWRQPLQHAEVESESPYYLAQSEQGYYQEYH